MASPYPVSVRALLLGRDLRWWLRVIIGRALLETLPFFRQLHKARSGHSATTTEGEYEIVSVFNFGTQGEEENRVLLCVCSAIASGTIGIGVTVSGATGILWPTSSLLQSLW